MPSSNKTQTRTNSPSSHQCVRTQRRRTGILRYKRNRLTGPFVWVYHAEGGIPLRLDSAHIRETVVASRSVSHLGLFQNRGPQNNGGLPFGFPSQPTKGGYPRPPCCRGAKLEMPRAGLAGAQGPGAQVRQDQTSRSHMIILTVTGSTWKVLNFQQLACKLPFGIKIEDGVLSIFACSAANTLV